MESPLPELFPFDAFGLDLQTIQSFCDDANNEDTETKTTNHEDFSAEYSSDQIENFTLPNNPQNHNNLSPSNIDFSLEYEYHTIQFNRTPITPPSSENIREPQQMINECTLSEFLAHNYHFSQNGNYHSNHLKTRRNGKNESIPDLPLTKNTQMRSKRSHHTNSDENQAKVHSLQNKKLRPYPQLILEQIEELFDTGEDRMVMELFWGKCRFKVLVIQSSKFDPESFSLNKNFKREIRKKKETFISPHNQIDEEIKAIVVFLASVFRSTSERELAKKMTGELCNFLEKEKPGELVTLWVQWRYYHDFYFPEAKDFKENDPERKEKMQIIAKKTEKMWKNTKKSNKTLQNQYLSLRNGNSCLSLKEYYVEWWKVLGVVKNLQLVCTVPSENNNNSLLKNREEVMNILKRLKDLQKNHQIHSRYAQACDNFCRIKCALLKKKIEQWPNEVHKSKDNLREEYTQVLKISHTAVSQAEAAQDYHARNFYASNFIDRHHVLEKACKDNKTQFALFKKKLEEDIDVDALITKYKVFKEEWEKKKDQINNVWPFE